MDGSTMGDDARKERTPTDSVDRDAEAWLGELPGVDAQIEMARMRLIRIGRQSDQMLTDIARRHELTLGDWETLSVLRRSGDPYVMTPSELVQALGVTSGTISVRIERLIQAGLIEPADGASDGRSRPVRLTEEGNRRWRAATSERIEIEGRLFQRALNPIEIEYLNDLLRWLMVELESDLGPPPRRADDYGE
jgi:DNA-binding MarR family transcriptional regulator